LVTLFILNDAPYGSEKSYNALRLALALLKRDNPGEIRVFLLADAVACALPNQKVQEGYYNIERMLKGVVKRGGKVGICGTCAEARGLANLTLVEGAQLSTLESLAEWTASADKVLIF
jgi:uncharacterized protein involved in oxidation of intracellular sulfur